MLNRNDHVWVIKKRGSWGQDGDMGQTDTRKMKGDKQKLNPGHFCRFENPAPDAFLRFGKRGRVLKNRGRMVTLITTISLQLYSLMLL